VRSAGRHLGDVLRAAFLDALPVAGEFDSLLRQIDPAMRAKPVLVLLSLLAVLAIGLRSDEPAGRIAEGNVSTFYKSFTRVTPIARKVMPSIAMLCTTPTAAARERIRQQAGPHHEALVHFYLNAVALQRADKKQPFAPGAIVIKEKIGESVPVAAVGGMRKREPGYDPENGDWEYFYSSRSGGFESGKIQSCIACHRRQKATDYVFGHWPTPKPPAASQ